MSDGLAFKSRRRPIDFELLIITVNAYYPSHYRVGEWVLLAYGT